MAFAGCERIAPLLVAAVGTEFAKADPSADETIIAFLEAEPSGVTTASHDEALAALNRAASELLLNQSDLVLSYE